MGTSEYEAPCNLRHIPFIKGYWALWERTLGASWVVLSGVISPIIWAISIVTTSQNPS